MKSFYIMNKNEPLYFVKMHGLSVELVSHNKNPFYKQFPTDNPSAMDVLDWFDGRCFPKERPNVDEYLGRLGLTEYDSVDIVKATHGLMWDDYIWVKWEGEDLNYEDIKIRD